MNNIKTIADFKRAMIPGTFWETTHKYIGEDQTARKSLGIRECVLNNTVGFGFTVDIMRVAHSDWPKRTEFSTEDGGNVVIITKPGFAELRYIQRN